MREVIIGADGFIGNHLAKHLPDAVKTTRRFSNQIGDWPFDLVEKGPLPEADIVYICAGVNGTLNCARDPQGTFRINVDGTIYVAEHYKDSHVVWISSTTVEWCQEAYAVQKRTTETVLRQMPHVGIVRAGRVINQNVDSLCETLINMGRSRLHGIVIWGEDEVPYDHGKAILKAVV